MSSSYGLIPDEWQAGVVDDTLAVRSDGRLVSSRCGWSAPRQNGKNVALEIVELYKMVIQGRKILHTAHEMKTAHKAFVRLQGFFESRAFPELGAMVKAIRRANGQEGIELHAPSCDQRSRCGCDWGSIEFIARSKGSGRGFTVDDLVCDEAQELDEFMYAALLPTVSASPSGDPQQIICGTPPGPKDSGEVFTRLRKDALGGRARRTVWLEWSMKPGSDLDDRAQWATANPALGMRLGIQSIEDERAAFDDVTFLRERGGGWAADAGTPKPIPDSLWASLLDPSSLPEGSLSLGIDQTPDASVTAIAVAGPRSDGRVHVELVEHREGSAWVPHRVVELLGRNQIGPVIVDKASPAFGLVSALESLGVVVTATHTGNMGQACSVLIRAVIEDGLRHVGQPQLSTAVSMARKRMIGVEGLWAWGRAVSAADISPTVAMTLAVWGVSASDAKPQARVRTGRGYFR